MNNPLDTQELPPLNALSQDFIAARKDPRYANAMAGYADTIVDLYIRERQLREALSRLSQLEKAATDLVEAMETCHICKGLIVLAEDPTHCEDCSFDCEGHSEPDCVPIYELHRKLKAALPSPPKEAL